MKGSWAVGLVASSEDVKKTVDRQYSPYKNCSYLLLLRCCEPGTIWTVVKHPSRSHLKIMRWAWRLTYLSNRADSLGWKKVSHRRTGALLHTWQYTKSVTRVRNFWKFLKATKAAWESRINPKYESNKGSLGEENKPQIFGRRWSEQ